ncbi:MAG: hypothetical protein R3F14_23485 [Polyangiaceae bacterium]
MQREDSAEATAAAGEIVEVQEEVRPAISLEDLVEATPGPRHAADAAAPNAGTAANAAPGLRVARVVSVTGRRARIGLRNKGIEIDATLAEDVQRELIEDAVREKAGVLVEIEENGEAVIVGVVQTRKPSEVRVTGEDRGGRGA